MRSECKATSAKSIDHCDALLSRATLLVNEVHRAKKSPQIRIAYAKGDATHEDPAHLCVHFSQRNGPKRVRGQQRTLGHAGPDRSHRAGAPQAYADITVKELRVVAYGASGGTGSGSLSDYLSGGQGGVVKGHHSGAGR